MWKPEYKYQQRYYEKNRQWRKKRRLEIRQRVVEAYGGKCICCDESHWQFLTLDHPEGDGQADRAKHHNTTDQLYGWVIKNGFPNNYRLLCMNCNWVRRYDTCPHQRGL